MTLLLVAELATAAPEVPLSEDNYLGELPVVLSVVRVAQALDEAPAAVTVIDRETIRRSGARDLAGVLRLVPGFIVSHYESGARPISSYHADYDSYTRHLQVFVDGRSVFSSLLVGTSNYGQMGIVLEDIERIEVVRGSNSAAYGANAFLGVVNIITRHAAETRGGMVAVTTGEGGIHDSTARLGWGDERAAFRLTATRQHDGGFANVDDNRRVAQLHFRGDLRTAPTDDLMLAAGYTHYAWGTDYSPSRTEDWRNAYANAQWTRRLAEGDQIKLNAQFDQEHFYNFIPILSGDGLSRRIEIGAEHSFAGGKDWRFVWGGQYRREQVVSMPFFPDAPDQRVSFMRIYGNAEWKPHPQWVFNAGAMREDQSIAGPVTAPRLAANFHVVPGQTLRVAATSAYRQPTLFELRSDWRLDNGTSILRASGNAAAERIDSTEFGYLGEFRALHLGVDLRVFHERVRSLLGFSRPCPGCPNDTINQAPNTQKGWETQLRWRPLSDTEVLANYTALRLLPDPTSPMPQDAYRAPSHNAMLALFQRLPEGFDLAVIHSAIGEYFSVRNSDRIPGYRQTDLRLARQFRIGVTRAEAALTVRAAGGGHIDFVERGYPQFYLGRQAMASLRLEF